jgi:uncharacterized surface protein with fasciclin (FAS1) repeats
MTHFHKQLLTAPLILAMTLFVAACSGSGGNGGGVANAAEDDLPVNIVQTAVAAGTFETLVAAVEAAGLQDTLADEEATFTVFAPTDAAFDLLGEETISALLADPDTLADILLYHVIAGQAVDSDTAISIAANLVEMANGDSVAVTLVDGELTINSSRVELADIQASNGVIHVIDAVLVPAPEDEMAGTIVDVALASPDFTTLVAALQATGLVDTLLDENGSFTVFAPTDAAFAALGTDTINALLADLDTLSDILLYHVVSGTEVPAAAAVALAGNPIEMANG